MKLKGRPIAATVTRRADRWFVSVTVEGERSIPVPKLVRRPTDVVGVDLGLANAAVIHDGSTMRVIEPKRALHKNLAKLQRLDRKLARKQKGSRNREKAKLQRARVHYRISCQRTNMLHQLSGSLARTKSVIVLEDLHVRGDATQQAPRVVCQRCRNGRAPPTARTQKRLGRLDARDR